MTISIRKTYKFEAAHDLPGHEGKCVNLHGHSYVLEVEVAGELRQLDTKASDYMMIMDFKDLDVFMKPLIDGLDHTYLNTNPKVKVHRTTAEAMVTWLATRIVEQLPEEIHLVELVLWETATSRAIFRNYNAYAGRYV